MKKIFIFILFLFSFNLFSIDRITDGRNQPLNIKSDSNIDLSIDGNSVIEIDTSSTIKLKKNILIGSNTISNNGNGIGLSIDQNGITSLPSIKVTSGAALNKVLTSDANGLATWENAQADNLGNHSSTQNLKLNSFYLSGDGGNEGVSVESDGSTFVTGTGGNILHGCTNRTSTISVATESCGTKVTTCSAGEIVSGCGASFPTLTSGIGIQYVYPSGTNACSSSGCNSSLYSIILTTYAICCLY